jgi:catechol 2,3-dioxygenase-like lactoylglutathione lyase family enzyme
MTPPTRIHHVGLTVVDPDVTAAFYTAVLDCTVEATIDIGVHEDVRRLVNEPAADLKGLWLRTPAGDRIEVLSFVEPPADAPPPRRRPRDAGTPHIALAVADLAEVAARLRSVGAAVIGGPVDLGSSLHLYCYDPDGTILEILQESWDPLGSGDASRASNRKESEDGRF